MKKARVFIGSSTQSLDLAGRIQRVLQSASQGLLEATVWEDSVFDLSSVTIQSLIEALDKYSFAVFVFSPDDTAVINGVQYNVARDNVVFETGLFMGRRGKDRVVIVRPQGLSLRLPTDLAGITYATYDSKRYAEVMKQAERDAVIRPCCGKISDHILDTHKRTLAEDQKSDISTILEIAARLVADRSGVSADEIRAFCHIYDDSDKHLVPLTCFTGSRSHDDATLRVPCSGSKSAKKIEDWYIISRSFRQGIFICEDINWSVVRSAPPGDQVNVWDDLKTVAAYPIHEHGHKDRRIGVVSVDGSKSAAELEWNDYDGLKYILSIIGRHIHEKILR